MASSTTNRLGDFLRSSIAVLKSFFVPFLERQHKNFKYSNLKTNDTMSHQM